MLLSTCVSVEVRFTITRAENENATTTLDTGDIHDSDTVKFYCRYSPAPVGTYLIQYQGREESNMTLIREEISTYLEWNERVYLDDIGKYQCQVFNDVEGWWSHSSYVSLDVLGEYFIILLTTTFCIII